MKTSLLRTWLLVAIVMALPAVAAERKLTFAPGAKLSLSGDSTLHPYQAMTRSLALSARVVGPGSDLLELIRGKGIESLSLTVPVTTLSSGERGLDKNLQKALEAATHPDIVLRVERYELKPAQGAGGETWLHVSGTLAVARAERPVELMVRATPTSHGLKLKATKALTMTQFGVKPPVLMAGMIRCRDEVTVDLEGELTLQ
jgi:hypothetical protein